MIHLALSLGLLLPWASLQDRPANDRLAIRLEDLKRLADDPTLAIGQRESAAMEMVGALDETARAADGPAEKASFWDRAIAVLGEFNEQNEGHPRSREFQLQAGVYRWAQGMSWRQHRELNPADEADSRQAASALDDAISRFRAIKPEEGETALSENVRYRLSRALADRAELEPSDSPARKALESEAVALTAPPPTEPGLKTFNSLLRAELLRRVGHLDEAAAEVESASRLDPPPPPRDLFEARLEILTSRQRWAEAEALIKAAPADDPTKNLALVRLRIAQLSALDPGAGRDALEQDLFRVLDGMRTARSPQARRALVALAASGLKTSKKHSAMASDVMADAFEIRGDLDRAAELESQAAAHADEASDPAGASAYRLKAGAMLFRAGRLAEADALLSRVCNDPKAGASRSKAGLLLALARGRALAAGAPGVTAASYADALERQIRDFPAEPSTDEARWLLANLSRAADDTSRARSLWKEIGPGSPRWLDARLAAAALNLFELETLLVTSERATLKEDFRRAQDELQGSVKQARGDAERAALLVAEARLNLVPLVGNSRHSLECLDRITTMPMRPAERYRARLLRLVALVQTGPPYLQAEREAQMHASWAEPTGRTAFLEATRLLDECATYSEEDLHERRLGMVLRLLVQPAASDPDEERWTAVERAELRMRLARALLFLGDERGARAALRTFSGPPRGTVDDALLRDLADTYNRIEAYELAIDVERLRSRNLKPGSPAWFGSRYGLALAYFRSGQLAESAQLINGTAILHPNLGGGAIEQKFIRLRQRIGSQH
ncbi:hypothetical protein OJF2_21740 [Aquisphaera giovannonii]|uniref:Tetratricopeptide repeat protein n=1 Tax=Aquisphaera giovannonii TaxID=406548 RepID=A0A5B9VZF1_9BACT|nr:hypothetical protein [Aquisphaera giovannonii]QEH33668.1 hypothetical protein OJF2_21740 [Aquisphaera giovannonii]